MPQQIIGLGLIVIGGFAKNPSLITTGFVMLLGSTINDMLNQPPGHPDDAAPSGGILINTQSTQEPIKIIYGQVKTGVNRTFVHTTGINSEKLHIIACFGEGPINALTTLYLDEKDISLYGASANYTFHSGAHDQTYDTGLYSYYTSWTDNLEGTAYVYIRLDCDLTKFVAFPLITAVLQGRKLYDPRNESIAYSNNPALVIWDLMINGFYGLGLSSAFLNVTSFQSAANWYDTRNYTFNGVIYDREPALDVIQKVLDNCQSAIIWSGGAFKLKPLAYDASVMVITEDDILEGSCRATCPSAQSAYNAYRLKFSDADNNYSLTDLIVDDKDIIATDGEVREREVYLIGTNNFTQARKLGAYMVDRSRMNREYSFMCRPKALALEPGDIVTVTCDTFGWSSQVARVMRLEVNTDYTIAVTLFKEAESIYNDVIDTETHAEYSTTLPDPLAVPPSVSNVVMTEDDYAQGDNTYFRVLVTFDPPSSYPFYDYAEAYISWDAGVTYKFLGKNSSSFTIENLREGQTFKIKLLTVSTYNVKQTLAGVSAIDHTVTGLVNAPSNVGGFFAVVTRENINFRWTAISDTDLLYYELRYGLSWSQSFLVTRTKGTMYSIHGIRPGQHTFVLKACNTAGIYSAVEAIVTVQTFASIGYTEESRQNEDFDGGTHNGTVYYDHPLYGRILIAGTAI